VGTEVRGFSWPVSVCEKVFFLIQYRGGGISFPPQVKFFLLYNSEIFVE